ncbi:YciI family protein [Dactylosporangium darangshiense]|uniref:YciI family protein n=2 Tax=Dactylosporangium darangshiense TaxID=579108 RepID=A0ABP8DRN9_9ACTN
MKYMLLAYTGQTDWAQVDVTSAEFQAMCQFYADLGRELTESGELVLTEGLADPSLTRTLRRRDGGVAASDGPYAEAKEVLVSFAIVDCASHERVMAIAARVVDAVGDTVEVRPIMGGPPGADA